MDELRRLEAGLWNELAESEQATIAARTALRLLPNTSYGKLSQNPAINLTPDFREALIQVTQLTGKTRSDLKGSQSALVRASMQGIIDVVDEFTQQAPYYAAQSASAAAAATQSSTEAARAAGEAAQFAVSATRAAEAAQISAAICRSIFGYAQDDIEVLKEDAESDCFTSPLLPLDERHLLGFWNHIQSSVYGHSALFGFWREWYQGFLDGEPLDWELQRRVANIDQSIWETGQENILEEIERIRARWQVEKALKDLDDDHSVQTIARHGIGGNNPPESIQDERLSGAITLIWEATEELSTAMEQEGPAREWVEAILAKLKSGLASLLKWCAGKVNLAVGTAIVVGTTKGATVVADTYIAKHPEKIEALIEALERWLPFLS